MLLIKFVPNSTFKRCSYGINISNYDDKFAPSAIFRITAENWCLKGAGTKMHKCLVGFCQSAIFCRQKAGI